MIAFKNSRLAIIACIAFLAVFAESGCTAHAEEATGEIIAYVPAELGPIPFGAPVFLPVALFNPSEETLFFETLSSHGPDLLVTLSSSGERLHAVHFNQSFGGGHATHHPPQTLEATVLLINFWNELSTSKLHQDGNGELSLAFDAPMSLSGDRLGKIRGDTRVKVRIAGSALTKVGEQSVLNVARNKLRVRNADGVQAIANHTGHLSPFAPGASPLALRSSTDRTADWFNPESELVESSRHMIKPGSSLSRFLDISIILRRLKNSHSPESWEAPLEEFDEAIADCAGPERSFYVYQLAGAFGNAFISKADPTDELRERLRNMYPEFALCFFDESEGSRRMLRP